MRNHKAAIRMRLWPIVGASGEPTTVCVCMCMYACIGRARCARCPPTTEKNRAKRRPAKHPWRRRPSTHSLWSRNQRYAFPLSLIIGLFVSCPSFASYALSMDMRSVCCYSKVMVCVHIWSRPTIAKMYANSFLFVNPLLFIRCAQVTSYEWEQCSGILFD